jgi:hypothetical protein
MRNDILNLARSRESPHFASVNSAAEFQVADAPHPLQVKAWRALSGDGRSELAAALRCQARGWKRDALRTQHPAWTEERIERELAAIYRRGNT